MRVADEDLRHGPPTPGPPDHLVPQGLVVGDLDLLELRALTGEQSLGAGTVAAPALRVDHGVRHGSFTLRLRLQPALGPASGSSEGSTAGSGGSGGSPPWFRGLGIRKSVRSGSLSPGGMDLATRLRVLARRSAPCDARGTGGVRPSAIAPEADLEHAGAAGPGVEATDEGRRADPERGVGPPPRERRGDGHERR